MNIKYDFSEKLVIVTGGTKGIGKALAEAFTICGARVIVTYSSDDTAAQNLKNLDSTGLLEVFKCDVSSYAEVENFFNDLEEKKIAVDVLVNNAGVRRDSVLGMMKEADWSRVIDINLTGTYNMCKFAVLNMMKQRFGRIINITSPGRNYGFEGQANYSASKAGIVGLARSLSKEVAKRKITVNCVSPGFIKTELIDSLPDELKKEYVKMIPLRRFGTVSDVSPLVLFLASDEASYITGSVFDVDGGL
jgi:3-oxoacyl-[acyl-carrier protein] reductase